MASPAFRTMDAYPRDVSADFMWPAVEMILWAEGACDLVALNETWSRIARVLAFAPVPVEIRTVTGEPLAAIADLRRSMTEQLVKENARGHSILVSGAGAQHAWLLAVHSSLVDHEGLIALLERAIEKDGENPANSNAPRLNSAAPRPIGRLDLPTDRAPWTNPLTGGDFVLRSEALPPFDTSARELGVSPEAWLVSAVRIWAFKSSRQSQISFEYVDGLGRRCFAQSQMEPAFPFARVALETERLWRTAAPSIPSVEEVPSVVVSVRNRPPVWQVGTQQWSALGFPGGRSELRIDFFFSTRENNWSALWSSGSSVYSKASLTGWAEHFGALAVSILRAPHRAASQLSMLGPGERERVLLAGTRVGEPQPTESVLHLFLRQAEQTPDALAVDDGASAWTYSRLSKRAAAVAAALRQQRVQPGARVAICLPPSPEVIAAMLGVWLARAAYVVLDPDAPHDRLRSIVASAYCPLVIGSGDPASALGLPLLDPASVAQEAPANAVHLEAASEAYVMYTSGSTGEPKGVVVPHGALANHAIALQQELGLNSNDRVYQFASLSFDAAGEAIFPALTCGAAVSLRGATVPSPRELDARIRREGITAAQVTPLLLQEWAAELVSRQERVPPSLRRLFPGGDRLPRLTWDLWCSAGGAATAWNNNYGPTETTITATSFLQTSEVLPTMEFLPIGRPILNVRVYLLDEEGEPVPFGLVGEVFIGGAGVSLGYLGQPRMTAERFVPDPFSSIPGARMYRTGDLARYLPDGNIAFLGRRDSQVKIRGFRVEPGEVEAALQRLRGVRDVTVVARDDSSGSKQLVAYVVGDKSLSGVTLREDLRTRLPAYMIPSAWVFLDAMPLTSSGKVNKQLLPPPVSASHGPTEDASAGVEESLLAIWRELLGTPTVGPLDDFFELGGHSILGMQMIARVQETFGVELSLRSVFELPTVRRLAEEIEALTRTADVDAMDDEAVDRLLQAVRRSSGQ